MSFERVHRSKSQSPQASSSTSQFAPRPFSVQEPKRLPTQEDIENEAFQQNKFEAFGLQLREKHSTITPVEQERLGVLQAKMDGFWAQRMERAKAQPNLLEILIRNSQATQTTESQTPVRSNTVQEKADIKGDRPDSSVEQHPNKTGMPDALKAGVESLSGYSLDNVRVHYNSPKPSQLQALAYTQGTEIHVASGHEEHLPHEAWHVVQQAQGRVKPTMQMKDGVAVNDESALEREAEVMGRRAAALVVTAQGQGGLPDDRVKQPGRRDQSDRTGRDESMHKMPAPPRPHRDEIVQAFPPKRIIDLVNGKRWVVEELPQDIFMNTEQCLDAYEKWLRENLTEDKKIEYCDWLQQEEKRGYAKASARLETFKDLVTRPKKGPPGQPKKQLSAEERERAGRKAAATKQAKEMKRGKMGTNKDGAYYGGSAKELHVHVVGGEAILKYAKDSGKTFINGGQVNEGKLAETREAIMSHPKAEDLLIAINRALIEFGFDRLVEQRQDIDKNGKPKP